MIAVKKPCKEFPHQLSRIPTLLADFPAVDPFDGPCVSKCTDHPH